MSRYDALTQRLRGNDEAEVLFTFDEIDDLIGGLPESARKYRTWWTNNPESQPHSKYWIEAGRRALPNLGNGFVTFILDSSFEPDELAVAVVEEGSPTVLAEYVENSLSLERDLENHIVHHLQALEPGLVFVSRQEVVEVGRLDLLAKDAAGNHVIIELKAGEAKDSAIGQIARYMGWFTHRDGHPPRAILIASTFSDSVRYAAKAIPGLKLVSYRVSFSFDDMNFR